AGASGLATQAPPQLLIGLGEADHIDLLRILSPTGILQDEIDLPHTQVIAMKEADRRGSSCPVLFAWDGKRYKLVTDVIGAAVVGHWFTPERRNTPNPGEWIKVDGARVPVGAWDGEQRDVTDVLSKRDHRFASGFTPTPYDGFANLHALTLD